MSSRHSGKRKKNRSQERSTQAPVATDAPCQEHPNNRKGDDVEDRSKSRAGFQDWRVDAAILVSLVALVAYFTQAYYMRQAMRVDQRAWISMPFPNSFPMNGTSIPAVTQIINSGKTPAKGLVVDIFASVLNKDDKPTVGDFSVGHPHERLHAPGVIFPHDPTPVNVSVGTYLPEGGEEATVPNEALRQDIASGKRFILFYGRATYLDVFEVQHYTQFCTGS